LRKTANRDGPAMRISLVVLVFAFAGLLVVDLQSSPPRAAVVAPARAVVPKPAPKTVEVAFVKNGWIVRVERLVPKGMTPAEAALRELTQGPTKLERRKGIRTALPERARLRSLRVQGTTWLASFSRSTLGAGSAETKRTRIWQITATLASLGDEEHVALAAEGRYVTTARLGLRPGVWRAETGENDYPYVVRGVQLRLAELGFLDRSDVTGADDYLTEQALLAFQGWEDLDRTGTVTGQTQVALFRAGTPRPASHRRGKHVEISLARGVVLLVEDGKVVRVVHASTGSLGRTPTGDFHVYAKSLYSWSVPFHVWMPFASYFRGGIAMHQSPDVPSYPASHGCVRLPEGEAQRVYGFVDLGTPVSVR
jgi:L,D-transpeptidase-like protein/sporulation and spore germination protein/putative peptidoglycan binding protein